MTITPRFAKKKFSNKKGKKRAKSKRDPNEPPLTEQTEEQRKVNAIPVAMQKEEEKVVCKSECHHAEKRKKIK